DIDGDAERPSCRQLEDTNDQQGRGGDEEEVGRVPAAAPHQPRDGGRDERDTDRRPHPHRHDRNDTGTSRSTPACEQGCGASGWALGCRDRIKVGGGWLMPAGNLAGGSTSVCSVTTPTARARRRGPGERPPTLSIRCWPPTSSAALL